MSETSYSEWHTLTVEPDYEDDDGTMVMDYSLDHPEGCPPADPDAADAGYCWVDEMVGEEIGLPKEPGVYRVRAWGTSEDWFMDHYIEPDGGLEIEELDMVTR